VNAIEVNNLRKSYKDFLLDVSFDIPAGYVCGFVGRNGAGKTTALKCLLGMVIPNGGEVTILGKPYSDMSLKEELGVLLDQPYFQEDWTAADIETYCMSACQRPGCRDNHAEYADWRIVYGRYAGNDTAYVFAWICVRRFHKPVHVSHDVQAWL
jgi:ABC-2 type transport system ATP-binding protein